MERFQFTLRDLIVLVILAGGVMGFVLYATSRAREGARRAQCASNLSKIGIACSLYAADSGRSLAAYPEDARGAMYSLNLIYPGYLKQVEYLSCSSAPGDLTGLAKFQPIGPTGPKGSPQNSRTMVPDGQPTLRSGAGRHQSAYGYDPGHNPTHAVAGLAADFLGSSPGGKKSGNSTNHGLNSKEEGWGQNFLLCDGHVEWLSEPLRALTDGVNEDIFSPDADVVGPDEDAWIRGD